MTDQEQKQEQKQETTITSQPDAENKKEGTELTEEQLKKISGGGLYISNNNNIGSATSTKTYEKWIEI